MVYIIIFLVIVFVAVFIYLQNNIIVTEGHFINYDMNNLKIVHLSDLHSKSYKNRLYEKVRKLSPDMIVVTGDLIDDDGRNIDEMISLMKRFAKLCKTVYILGNHDHRLDTTPENIAKLMKADADVLINEIKDYEINDSKISILGLDEDQASNADYKKRKEGKFTYKDNSKHFELLKQKDGFKICLTHYPENFVAIGTNSYNQYDFDLMLCGHAHGGQFRLPFIGGLFSPGQGLFPKFCSGEFGTRPKMIVSRGLGNSRFPFRLFNFPQIIVVNIGRNL